MCKQWKPRPNKREPKLKMDHVKSATFILRPGRQAANRAWADRPAIPHRYTRICDVQRLICELLKQDPVIAHVVQPNLHLDNTSIAQVSVTSLQDPQAAVDATMGARLRILLLRKMGNLQAKRPGPTNLVNTTGHAESIDTPAHLQNRQPSIKNCKRNVRCRHAYTCQNPDRTDWELRSFMWSARVHLHFQPARPAERQSLQAESPPRP